MYKCKVCQAVAPSKQKLLRHVVARTVTPTTPINVKRTGVVDGKPTTRYDTVAMPVGPSRTEVAREVPVCGDCHKLLQTAMLQGTTDRDALLKLARDYAAEPPDGYGPPAPEPAAVARPQPVRFVTGQVIEPTMEYRVETDRGSMLIAAKSQAQAEHIARDDGHHVIKPTAAQAVKFGGTP